MMGTMSRFILGRAAQGVGVSGLMQQSFANLRV
jgi:hypothetical protein